MRFAHLLYNIISENISHQSTCLGKDLRENQVLLFNRSSFQFLLYKATPILIRTEGWEIERETTILASWKIKQLESVGIPRNITWIRPHGLQYLTAQKIWFCWFWIPPAGRTRNHYLSDHFLNSMIPWILQQCSSPQMEFGLVALLAWHGLDEMRYTD